MLGKELLERMPGVSTWRTMDHNYFGRGKDFIGFVSLLERNVLPMEKIEFSCMQLYETTC